MARQCKVRMHNHCYTNFRRRNTKCPACQQEWAGPANENRLLRFGEEAARDGAEHRVTRRAAATQRDGDEEAESEEEETQPSQTQTQTQSQTPTQTQRPSTTRRGKGKKPAVKSMDAGYDEDEKDQLDDDDDTEPSQEATQATRNAKGKGRAIDRDVSPSQATQTQRRTTRRR